MQSTVLFQALIFILCAVLALSRELLELEGSNFELTITAYKYLAVLFYDHSAEGKELLDIWSTAVASLYDPLPEDCEIGKVKSSMR